MTPNQLSIAECISLACLWEVSAIKPGNVHRGADFPDLHFADFLTSAAVLGPALTHPDNGSLGDAILRGVKATRSCVSTNTNLGIILLLAPLAQVNVGCELQDGVAQVLDTLTPRDASLVYEAIQLAQPGGMGEAAEHDVRGEPPSSLLVAMKLAADHDMIAAQYVNGFSDVLNFLVPRLSELSAQGTPILDAIVRLQVECLAKYPDSLIQRKRGKDEAKKAAELAKRAVDTGQPNDGSYFRALGDLDFWMRSSTGRNPGTTADLVTASIFCCLRNGSIRFPIEHWSFGAE